MDPDVERIIQSLSPKKAPTLDDVIRLLAEQRELFDRKIDRLAVRLRRLEMAEGNRRTRDRIHAAEHDDHDD